MDNMIRVRLGMETVWCRLTDRVGVAIVDNVPFSANVGLGDHIRYKDKDGVLEFVRIVKKVSNTAGVRYASTLRTAEKNFEALTKYLESKGLHCEGMYPGMLAISVPLGFSVDKVREIVSKAPIKAEIVE